MKNSSLIINVVLAVALAVLYVLFFTSKNGSSAVSENSNETSSSDLKIAYVNIDSILVNYTLSKELNESLMGKQSNMKSRLEKEGREFEKDAQIFQDKVQRGVFLTQQRAEEAQQQLLQRQQELQQLEYEYSNQLASEQQKMNIQLFDSITNFISDYNNPEKYQVILGHSLGGNMLYGSAKIDITTEVIKGLNQRYTSNK